MDWNKGYSATYYMKRIDPATWKDLETINLTGGSIKREASGLRQSADVDCVNYKIELEQWVRIYLDTRQNGAAAHVPLFTGLATSPEDEYSGIIRKNALECYSVLKPADDIYLMRGWYAQAGRHGGDVIKQLLEVIPAPVVIADESPRLEAAIIAEDSETRLTMVDKVLTAINWRLRIDGDGTVYVEPKPIEAVAMFDPIENDVIETELKISADWYSCPNVFMAISEDMTGIARDDSPDSPLSTVNRGREVWMVEDGANLSETESIAQYAQRMLNEAQRIQKTVEYDRRYMPHVGIGDIVRLRYPAQGLDGIFAVDSQSIELGYGARTSEQISTVVTPDDLKERKLEAKVVYLIDDSGAIFEDASGDPNVALTEV